jgi:hypothetical protein
MSRFNPSPTDQLYSTICEIWPQYASYPRSGVVRQFLRKYPATRSYRELLLLPSGVPDPLNLFKKVS